MHKIMKSILILLLFTNICFAETRVIDLVIDYKDITFGKNVKKAMTINNQLPGPTLELVEGERVSINVHNKMEVSTSLHWHGLLVPWQMDGVSGVSQIAIKPGGTYKYEFTPLQTGTYWYHSHRDLQEQEGLYGALIIKPKDYQQKYDQDITIVLSDWSNTPADAIYERLVACGLEKKPGCDDKNDTKDKSDEKDNSDEKDKKDTKSKKNTKDKKSAGNDYNDVVYDYLLLNGKSSLEPWQHKVSVGQKIRLRFIGAGTSTTFRVKIPHKEMEIINIQGNDVKPYIAKDFYLAPGETIDATLTIEPDMPYLIYAESISQTAHIYGALVDTPKENLQQLYVDKFEPTTPEMLKHTYENVVSTRPTNDASKEIYKTINMSLTGSMSPYVWSIDGKIGDDSKPIIIRPNKRYRLIMTNETMMPHPMHIHGHWFILRKNLGEFDPLLHTVLVAPKDTVAVDIDTDASGQWFFHCHVLYHLKAGMFRVFRYANLVEVFDDEKAPQNIVKDGEYYNSPIVKVDRAKPISSKLIYSPMPY